MVEARRCSWFAPRMNIGWPKSEEMCRRWIKQGEPLFRQERAANANRHSHAHFRIGNNIWKKNPSEPNNWFYRAFVSEISPKMGFSFEWKLKKNSILIGPDLTNQSRQIAS